MCKICTGYLARSMINYPKIDVPYNVKDRASVIRAIQKEAEDKSAKELKRYYEKNKEHLDMYKEKHLKFLK